MAVFAVILGLWWLISTDRKAGTEADVNGTAPTELLSNDSRRSQGSMGELKVLDLVETVPEPPQAVEPEDEEEFPRSLGHNFPHDPETCAVCVAEKKLTPLRDEYAEMRFDALVEAYQIPESHFDELRTACNDIARATVREWSFSETRPLLVDDTARQQIEEQRLKALLEELGHSPLSAP